jgi:putative tryptophan/tyrosine transport system substrate-binding protein
VANNFIRRRDALVLAAAAATFPIAWPCGLSAQQRQLPVAGLLYFGTEDLGKGIHAAFRDGLAEQGYVDGRNVEILYRSTDTYDRLPELAADLMRRQVAVIATMGAGTPTLPAQIATPTVPSVFLISGAPIAIGFVPRINDPGANATMRLGLLRQMLPAATSIGYLHNPTLGTGEIRIRTIETAARVLGIRLVVAHASTPSEIEPALTTLIDGGINGLMLGTNPLFIARTDQIIAVAAKHRLPAAYPYREQVALGGLLSYGGSISEAWHLAGAYAGRILRGEKPEQVPMQQSARIETLVNLKTAKALGIEVPAEMLLHAAEAIE